MGVTRLLLTTGYFLGSLSQRLNVMAALKAVFRLTINWDIPLRLFVGFFEDCVFKSGYVICIKSLCVDLNLPTSVCVYAMFACLCVCLEVAFLCK